MTKWQAWLVLSLLFRIDANTGNAPVIVDVVGLALSLIAAGVAGYYLIRD